MLETSRKDQFTYQFILLGLMVFFCAFPLLLPYIRPLAPEMFKCPCEPCPFCGTTTYLYRFFKHGAPLPYHLQVGAWCMGIELVRKLGICLYLLCGGCMKRRWITADICLTILCTLTAVSVFIYRWFTEF